jgi:hypothetical protein
LNSKKGKFNHYHLFWHLSVLLPCFLSLNLLGPPVSRPSMSFQGPNPSSFHFLLSKVSLNISAFQ